MKLFYIFAILVLLGGVCALSITGPVHSNFKVNSDNDDSDNDDVKITGVIIPPTLILSDDSDDSGSGSDGDDLILGPIFNPWDLEVIGNDDDLELIGIIIPPSFCIGDGCFQDSSSSNSDDEIEMKIKVEGAFLTDETLTITITAEEEPLEDVLINVIYKGRPSIKYDLGRTDGDGIVEFTPVLVGTYEVKAYADRYSAKTLKFTVDSGEIIIPEEDQTVEEAKQKKDVVQELIANATSGLNRLLLDDEDAKEILPILESANQAFEDGDYSRAKLLAEDVLTKITTYENSLAGSENLSIPEPEMTGLEVEQTPLEDHVEPVGNTNFILFLVFTGLIVLVAGGLYAFSKKIDQ
ncbi:hypothetical protein KAW38_02410 [Candidatus Micrarchaeota archaeon]|nr:hypothetical protein [Candidatus Micrarchaeota archaeon]